MKGSFNILLLVLLVITGILVFIILGPMMGEIGLIAIEALIVAAIVILLVRHSRSSRS